MHLTILGAGYSGRAIAREFLAAGYRVSGTTRSAEKAEALRAIGIEPLILDDSGLSPTLAAALSTTTHLVQSIAPGGAGDPFLPLTEELPFKNLKWIGYLSTVGVYGNHDGAWVDEETVCKPVSARSRERVDAEAAWTAFGAARGVPVALLRLSP